MSASLRPQFPEFINSRAGIGAVIRERPQKYLMLMTFAQEILREEGRSEEHTS